MVAKVTPARFDRQQLEALIDEGIVDCYDEMEQAAGLFAAIQDNVRVPFRALDGDEEVTVLGFEMEDMLVTATCDVDGTEDDVPLMDLTLIEPLPEGAAWIAAYCLWANHNVLDDDEGGDDDDR